MREAALAGIVRGAKRPVVKIGSSLLEPGGLDPDGFCRDLFALWPSGVTPVLVSSGAVAAGRRRGLTVPRGLAGRQALSAVGQGDVFARWRAALAGQGREAAQLLLTPDVTDDRGRYLNARAVLSQLAEAGVVAVVNENDAVSTEELRYGDNDGLAARVASLVGADLLVLLSDVAGLYTANPARDVGAAPVPVVPFGEAGALTQGATAEGSGSGTGGMRSKVEAASLAAGWGVPTVIASGLGPAPLSRLADAAQATLFEAGERRAARWRWIAGAVGRSGVVHIDQGAASALAGGASLLPIGVERVGRAFRQGEVVAIMTGGDEIGFGLAATGSEEMAAAKPVIRAENMVVRRR